MAVEGTKQYTVSPEVVIEYIISLMSAAAPFHLHDAGGDEDCGRSGHKKPCHAVIGRTNCYAENAVSIKIAHSAGFSLPVRGRVLDNEETDSLRVRIV